MDDINSQQRRSSRARKEPDRYAPDKTDEADKAIEATSQFKQIQITSSFTVTAKQSSKSTKSTRTSNGGHVKTETVEEESTNDFNAKSQGSAKNPSVKRKNGSDAKNTAGPKRARTTKGHADLIAAQIAGKNANKGTPSNDVAAPTSSAVAVTKVPPVGEPEVWAEVRSRSFII